MSFCPESGINIVWHIEKFDENYEEKNEDLNLKSCIQINWPSIEAGFKLTYYEAKNNSVRIRKNEFLEGIKDNTVIYGNISVFTSADSIKFLNEFSTAIFHDSEDSYLHVELEQLKKILASSDNLLRNDTLTFLIQLWNSPKKQKIDASCHAYSRLSRQKCNFEWPLDTTIEKDNETRTNILCHIFKTKVPRSYTTYRTKQRKTMEPKIELSFESFLETKEFYQIEIKAPEIICLKLKIDAVTDNQDKLNLMDTLLDRPDKSFNIQKIQNLVTNKHLYYPQGLLTLNILIENIFYLRAEITEIDYLSDTQNIAALFDWSNKFRKRICSDNSSETLSPSMYALFKEGDFCDVTLCVEEELFPCHKSVLCARSPVFKAMFKNNMQESESHNVVISDMKAHSFRIFLNALYTDSVHDAKWDDALKVYEAAHKYDVPSIRKACSNFLLSKLSIRNVCQLLEFSVTYQDDYLNKRTKEFLTKHVKQVIKLPYWEEFMAKNPLFAAKLMVEILSH